MAYLQRNDYKQLIQADNLNQIINSDATILSGVELAAQAEAISYLTQKYIVTEEFADLLTWSTTVSYKAKQRVTIDAAAYNATSGTYVPTDLVLQAGNIYECAANIAVPEPFAPVKWVLIGPQYKIFYVTLPADEFNLNHAYKVGDSVFWKDSVYTCKIATGSLTQEQYIQYGLYSNVPAANVFPDDPDNGVIFWGVGVPYSLNPGVRPDESDFWTAGDNRNPQLVNYFIDIVLYHVHTRIAPRNIPELRVKRYDDAIKWLKMAGRGEITAALPLIQPKSGARIRFGGHIKNVNSY